MEENRDASVSMARIAELAGVGRGAAAMLAHRLAGKGWLERVAKGTYALASLVHRPSYVGWWAAASFHRHSTQVPATIHVTVPKQAPPRVVAGSEVRFVKAAARKFFGAARFEVFGREALISGLAKTLLDCVDRPNLCRGASVDPAELVACAERSGSAAAQRLGCLLDIVGRPLAGEARGALEGRGAAVQPRGQPEGVAIKVQASLREFPVLAPVAKPQAVLPYFGDLGFQPSAIPCLRLEAVVAEKVRAASKRPKGRGLYDLAEIARNPACSAIGSSPTWTRWRRRSSWRLHGRTPTTRPPKRWRRI